MLYNQPMLLKMVIKIQKNNTSATVITDVIHEFTNIVEKTQSSLKDWKDLEIQRNSAINKIEQTMTNAKNRVKINVRGSLFSASKKTLIAIPNTYFYGLITNSDKFKPRDDGTYFIERNPVVFDRVLDYLRTGKLEIRDLTLLSTNILKDDFDYYCIPLPNELKPLSWDVNRRTVYHTYTNNNLTVTSSTSSGAIGNKAVDRYTVKVESDKNLMIGFTTGAKYDVNSGNLVKNGWFIYAFNRKLYDNVVSWIGYSTPIKVGDYITVIREGTTIRFQKNKIDLEVCTAFKEIPNRPLFPVIKLYGSGGSVTLVNDY